VLRALWKIDVHLISTLVNKSLYYPLATTGILLTLAYPLATTDILLTLAYPLATTDILLTLALDVTLVYVFNGPTVVKYDHQTYH